MDLIKDSFKRVKEDINFLKEEIIFLKESVEDLRKSLIEFGEFLQNFEKRTHHVMPNHSANTSLNPTPIKNFPADKMVFKALKPKYLPFSIGNRGVPTDRQTDRQTDKSEDFFLKTTLNPPSSDPIADAAKILESLDALAKEIRIKFKKLTPMETSVFATIYQFTEEKKFTDYKALSKKLNLTESSVRDYIGKLVNKGIPIEKHKVNNKSILLKVSQDLMKIAPLSTILRLRDL